MVQFGKKIGQGLLSVCRCILYAAYASSKLYEFIYPDLTQAEVLLKVDPELGDHDGVLIKDQS